MAPETGAINPKYDRMGRDVSTRTASETACLKDSNPETGEVAIAHCDTRRAHQQAVDRGHQAAEQGGGRREADSSSLGHLSPLSWQAAGGRLVVCRQSMYTRYHHNRFVCIAAFLILHRSKNGVTAVLTRGHSTLHGVVFAILGPDAEPWGFGHIPPTVEQKIKFASRHNSRNDIPAPA